MGRALLLAVLLVWAGGAAAQPVKDCSQVPAGYRGRCEEAKRLQQICMGLKEPDRHTCVQKNIHYGRLKSDCSAANTPEKKATCAKMNHEMDLAEHCSGKIALDLKNCLAKLGVDSAPAGQAPAPAAAPLKPAPGTAAPVLPNAAAKGVPKAATN